MACKFIHKVRGWKCGSSFYLAGVPTALLHTKLAGRTLISNDPDWWADWFSKAFPDGSYVEMSKEEIEEVVKDALQKS